jgi:replicative DNA helicase
MLLNLKKLSDIKPHRARFILEDFVPIPRNAVTMLSSRGGVGKTTLSLLMASKHIEKTGENVALWLSEDFAGQIRFSVNKMINSGMIKSHTIDKMLLIVNEPPQLAVREKGLFKANYEAVKQLGEELIKADVHFAIFDPLLAFYGGNENDNSEARVFIQAFASWANSSKITTLIIHHSGKGGGTRGAGAFQDGVRCAYELDFVRNEDGAVDELAIKRGLREILLTKDNWGAREYFEKRYGDEPAYVKVIAKDIEPTYHSDYQVEMPNVL